MFIQNDVLYFCMDIGNKSFIFENIFCFRRRNGSIYLFYLDVIYDKIFRFEKLYIFKA